MLHLLETYAAELEAEQAYANGDYGTATGKVQALVNGAGAANDDKGWYLQAMARYNYKADRPESQRLQVSAHKANRLLLKPRSGITVSQLTIVSQGRMERIAKWVRRFDDYGQLDVALSDLLGQLTFGIKADRFEQALDDLSPALGFVGERPDKEWKEGPDNLWALDDTHYILWECKSEVDVKRTEINKREAEQMNRSSAWFEKHYPGMEVARIIIHPGSVVPSAAAFTHEVTAMRESELRRFGKNIRSFFKSFESLDFADLSAAHIQKLVDGHDLSVPKLFTDYSKKLEAPELGPDDAGVKLKSPICRIRGAISFLREVDLYFCDRGRRGRRRVGPWTISIVLLLAGCNPSSVHTPPEGTFAELGLPNKVLTPGDKLDVTKADICTPGYTKKVRDVPAVVKRELYSSYHAERREGVCCEVDHLIPLELGGSNRTANLWPQRYDGKWSARDKDRIEARLHSLVCTGKSRS